MSDFASLVFGSYDHETVKTAVSWEAWQRFRISLLGKSVDEKFRELTRYVGPESTLDGLNVPIEIRRIQVTNYVHALRRGGLI